MDGLHSRSPFATPHRSHVTLQCRYITRITEFNVGVFLAIYVTSLFSGAMISSRRGGERIISVSCVPGQYAEPPPTRVQCIDVPPRGRRADDALEYLERVGRLLGINRIRRIAVTWRLVVTSE